MYVNRREVTTGLMDFLLERTIQVEYSKIYKIDNGIPQGSECSPVLFNIMIKDF